MGNDEAIRIVSEAVKKLDSKFKKFWDDSKYTEAHDVWVDSQVLRRKLDELRDTQRESIRST